VKTVGIIQARMTSSRLPGKVLFPLGNRPILQLIVERLRKSSRLSDILVAIPSDPEDDVLETFCKTLGVTVCRGSRDDVLERYIKALSLTSADTIVRVTADCPLIDPAIVDSAVVTFNLAQVDYLCLGAEGGFPRGINAEVVSRAVLETASREAESVFEREHVTPFIYTRPDRYQLRFVEAPVNLRRPGYRITIDEQADWDMVNKMLDGIGIDPVKIQLTDIIKFLDANPDVALINQHVSQKSFKEVSP